MAGQIKISPERLLAAAAQIEAYAKDYEQQYNQFYSKVDALHEGYQGDDYDAFKAKTAEFKDDFIKMKNLMESYARFLRVSAATYEDTQANNAAAARSLQG